MAPRVFRSTTSFYLAAAFTVAMVGLSIYLGIVDPAELTQSAPVLLAFAGVVWLTFGRPRLVVDESGITIINILRTTVVPWGRYQSLGIRWNLRIITDDGQYVVWALPISSRESSRIADHRLRQHHPAQQAVITIDGWHVKDHGTGLVVTTWAPVALTYVGVIAVLTTIALV